MTKSYATVTFRVLAVPAQVPERSEERCKRSRDTSATKICLRHASTTHVRVTTLTTGRQEEEGVKTKKEALEKQSETDEK